MTQKKLYRNSKDGMVAGILAGLSDYFGLDVTIWRLAFVFLLVVTCFVPMVATYLVAWIIVPKRPPVTGAAAEGATVIHDV